MASSHISTLTQRISQSSGPSSYSPEDDRDRSDLDDEELFAQLEEEIENSDAHLRDGGVEKLRRE